ncbi:MAG TPA: hypothetical protein VEI94_04150 [Candidatus Bathyarchaeia archaeon]|nr:hypothetical protein [Candidatus Bathyarchaeia archaeon]
MGRALSDDQIELYSRQIILRELGGTGQLRLLGARCLALGSGPAASAALTYLAAGGVGTIDVLGDASLRGLALAPLEQLNPDVVVRSLAQARAAPPIALDEYDLFLDLRAGRAATIDRQGAAEARTIGSPRCGSIALTSERAALALVLIPAGAVGCVACTRAPSAPSRGESPSAIDLALGGTMAAIAACRWVAGIATDERARALVLGADAATWSEVATERSLPCPRGCPV